MFIGPLVAIVALLVGSCGVGFVILRSVLRESRRADRALRGTSTVARALTFAVGLTLLVGPWVYAWLVLSGRLLLL